MTLTLMLAVALAPVSTPPVADTIRIEVGSPLIDGSVYQPHRARVRVHLNSLDTPPTNEWTNELTVGDSAGRRVARWVTLGQFDSAGTPGFDLRQTFDLVSLAPLGYRLRTRAGADISLAIDGKRMRGTRKTRTARPPSRSTRKFRGWGSSPRRRIWCRWPRAWRRAR
jgi:hypothetical protein